MVSRGGIVPSSETQLGAIHTSPIGVSPSACFKTNAICASENLDAFNEFSFSPIRDHKWKIPALHGLI
ncbi:hypothetical protein ACI0FR_03261 [Paenochrobactrum sp. BZR 201-1]